MNAAGWRGRIVYINPNSSTLPILHPEQAPEIIFMNERGRNVYKFLDAQILVHPLPYQSRLRVGQGPLYKRAPASDPALSTSMRKELYLQGEWETERVKYQREQRRSKPFCGTLPGQTVSRFFIEGDNHLVQLLFLYMSGTNVFVNDCEEEEKRKKTKLLFF